MDEVTLIAALIGAAAAIVAAVNSSRTAEKLQSREHDHQDRTRGDERCRELQSEFLVAIRGADLPPLPVGEGENATAQILDGLTHVARNCFERAQRADHVAAQLRAFCDSEPAEAAGRAVQALNYYGGALGLQVLDMIDNSENDARYEATTRAAASYMQAVAVFEEAVRRLA